MTVALLGNKDEGTIKFLLSQLLLLFFFFPFFFVAGGPLPVAGKTHGNSTAPIGFLSEGKGVTITDPAR